MGNLYSFSTVCLPLKELQSMMNSEVFIETGCFRGLSLLYALEHNFKKCYSCDIDIEMIDFCRSHLKQFSDRLEIVHADSFTFLNELLPKLSNVASIIYYLDAHLPGLDKGQVKEVVENEFTFPLERELEIINQHRPNHADIIICDDLRIYEDGDFDSGNWHERKRFNLSLDFTERFGYTVSKFNRDEGYFVLTK